MKTRPGIRTLGLLVLMTMGWLASGARADDFLGTSSGIFSNPAGPATMVTSGMGTDYVTWGDPYTYGTGPSSLQFTGAGFTGIFGAEFSLGTLTFFNGTIFPETQANSLELIITLDFASLGGSVQELVLPLQLINTPNAGTALENADIVALSPADYPSVHFQVDGYNYFLEFVRFGEAGPGGFITGGNQIHGLESECASGEVFVILTSDYVPPGAAVPTPATWLLAASGLAGLAGWRARPAGMWKTYSPGARRRWMREL